MDELRDRLERARLSNWEHWPAVKGLWPWFTALALIIALAIPWGIRAEERNLETTSRQALTEAGLLIEDISFTGRQATITADLEVAERNAAIAVLADLGGVSQITWREGSGRFIPPLPATTAAPTTTAAPEPGAEVTASISGGRITLRGTVPAAAVIKDLSDAAADLWGKGDVVNQLFVDDTVIAHPWLPVSGEAIGVLTMLIDPQLTLDAEGATLTGGAIDEDRLARVVERLEETLGPDVAIDNKVSVTPLDLPSFEIVAPGDGTASIVGTVAKADLRRAIVAKITKSAEEIEVGNELRVDEGTADVYLLRRIPEIVEALGQADTWTLRTDGEGLGGVATGGKTFTGNKVKPADPVADLLDVLASYLQADPDLAIKIEIHAEPREGKVDGEELAQQRADAIAAFLVRQGIDPERVTATKAAGEGEVLRFQLIPAEQ
jgi:flagellar motor protein MotB